MRRLIYTSHSVGDVTPFVLESILESARRNNERDAITGILFYHDQSFLQLLEGPDDAVDRCFARIQKDRRHGGCIRILSEHAASRIFPDWRMAYQTYGALSTRQQRQFVDINDLAKNLGEEGLQGHPMTMAVVMAFLSGFRQFDIAV